MLESGSSPGTPPSNNVFLCGCICVSHSQSFIVVATKVYRNKFAGIKYFGSIITISNIFVQVLLV